MADQENDDEIKKELSAGEDDVPAVAKVDDLPKKKVSGKKIILFIVLPLLFVAGGGGGLYFTGVLDSLMKSEEAVEEDHVKLPAHEEPEGPSVFYEVPDIIVNLSNSGSKQRFLKLSVTLELVGETATADIEKELPRVLDHFQTFLRELRVSDLEGSAGVYRIRQELLERVRLAAQGVYVKDVLFRDILIQ